MRKLNYIFVNYNSSKVTIECIISIIKNSRNSENLNKLIIIDNFSKNKDYKLLVDWINQQKNSKICCIQLSENIGYFKALNEGLKRLNKNDLLNNYTIVGNNDLEFPVSFSDVLISKKYNSDILVVSPNIQNLSGVSQNPYLIDKISRKKKWILNIYYSNYYLHIFMLSFIRKFQISKLHVGKKNAHIKQEIYAGHGACYVLTNNFFINTSNVLKSESFLYGEEIFLAQQVIDLNGKILYDPEIKVIHKEHSSIKFSHSKTKFLFMREGFKKSKKYI